MVLGFYINLMFLHLKNVLSWEIILWEIFLSTCIGQQQPQPPSLWWNPGLGWKPCKSQCRQSSQPADKLLTKQEDFADKINSNLCLWVNFISGHLLRDFLAESVHTFATSLLHLIILFQLLVKNLDIKTEHVLWQEEEEENCSKPLWDPFSKEKRQPRREWE